MAAPRIIRRVLDELVLDDQLDAEKMQTILEEAEDTSGEAMESRLVEEFRVPPERLLLAKARAADIPPYRAEQHLITEVTFAQLDQDFCAEATILPVGLFGSCLVLAVADPFDTMTLQRVSQMTRLKVRPVLALASSIQKQLEGKGEAEVAQSVGFGDVMESLNIEFESGEGNEDNSLEALEEESAPIIQLSSRIIEEAYFAGGSDIHIEPFETEARVRVRVDGVCGEKLKLPPKVCSALMARLKVMANLDIAEKRLPQDGRIVYKQFNRKGIDVDLRVSTAPLNHGEGCVMRILDKQKSTLPLPALGYSEQNLEVYRGLITRPYGMILHCGPTGSGKSMTLYSALNEINDPATCIRTAEDPIEYTLPGLLQMQMNRKIGLTFASALRAFLRQDPDVILVGEIRDQETAQIAVEAALTGHMLFSTLHTNDAPSTISRLTEMEIEPFMISASLVCVCAQRLMRRVCKTCKQPYTPEGREEELMMNALDWNGQVFRAREGGCPACNSSGYKGRVGIHELMATSEELVKGINAEYETAKLKRIAVRNGMKTLHQDSLDKVKMGITTITEAISKVPPDMENLKAIREAATLEEALLS